MILSFGNKLAEDLFDDNVKSKEYRTFPYDLLRVARRKLLYLYDCETLEDLMVPPSNKLEKLKGDLKDYYSIRINDKWRLIFRWNNRNAFDVKVLDYHK
jgi:toxin HigB-1